MTFEEFLRIELEELRHWSNDPELQFEPSYHNRLRRAYNAAQPKWQPIETAPKDGTMVRVGWWENNDWYEDSDYIEDGAWIRHADHYDHFRAVGIPGMTGPKEEPPYQYWMLILEPPEEK